MLRAASVLSRSLFGFPVWANPNGDANSTSIATDRTIKTSDLTGDSTEFIAG